MKKLAVILGILLCGTAAAQVTVKPNIEFVLPDTNTRVTVGESFGAQNVTVNNDSLQMGHKNFSFTQYRNGTYKPLTIKIASYDFTFSSYPKVLMQFSAKSGASGDKFVYANISSLPDLPSASGTDTEPVYRLSSGSDTSQSLEGNIAINETFSSGAVFTLEAGVPGSFDEKQNTTDSKGQTSTGGSSGGGGGSYSGPTQQQLNNINETLQELKEQLDNASEYIDFSSSSINAELKPGESKRTSITLVNNLNRSQTFNISTTSDVREYIKVQDSLTVAQGESKKLDVKITIPSTELPKSVSGSLKFSSSLVDKASIPVNIDVLPPDRQTLSLSLNPLFNTVAPGETLRFEAKLQNEGYTGTINVTTDIELKDPETGNVIARKTVTAEVGGSKTDVVTIEVPENATKQQYTLEGTSTYTGINASEQATSIAPVTVATPFWKRKVAGVTYRNGAIASIILLILGIGGYYGYRYRQAIIAKKRRYDEDIDMETIPSGGEDQAYVGQIAERGKRTFVEMDDLMTHAMVAGATGSGKTVTGQVMAEEALKEGKNVIVLDPTAQWTGFLRENTDDSMFSEYDKFDMSKSDAQAFDGNIRAVEPGESIDITPYLNEDSDIDGQIIIFSLHKLDSKNIDKFVKETIQQVFDANLPEQNHLETMIVYDEVHRLLDEFGGSGKGLKQVERGAREFRKWGIGMLLLSQVISDFPHEVRTNIGTTVQMRTEDENDLDRMKDKFGMDTVKSIAKAEIGSGMLQNPEYNHGRPYFVNFRPPLHSPHRLSDSELEKYEQYNKMIDLLEQKVDKMKSSGKDTYELESEIQLARKNLKKGSFNLVETYIEELKEELQ